MSPAFSVIIPCFNHGAYLNEAVDSVLGQTSKDLEIVVVDDGSTDPATIALLGNYKRPKTTVIHTTNQGLAAARNNGIAAAKGKYILPLDADDRIAPTFLERAAAILDRNDRVGIVGSRVQWFGAQTGELPFPAYNFPLILVQCLFVCTSAFRREDWEKVGGYNTNLEYGHEDWDFWLSIIQLGREAYRIPELLFFYRKRHDSMLHSMTSAHKVAARAQIFRNHAQMYTDHIEALFTKMDELATHAEAARAQLNQFVSAAQGGREVTICDDSGPVAKLVSLRTAAVN